jgi:hypothetical protein
VIVYYLKMVQSVCRNLHASASVSRDPRIQNTLVAKARALAPFAEFEISRSRSRGVDDVTDCATPCHMREYNKVP